MMKQWWQSLNQREQQLIIGLGGFFLLIMLWRFMWLPWHESIQQAEQDIDAQTDLLLWMRRVVPVIEAAQHNSSGMASKAALSTRVEQLLATAPIDRTRIELGVNQDASVTMRIDQLPFDDLTQFLRTLAVRASVTIESAELHRVKEGVVSGDLTLR